ncbi:venom serine protease inhibitor-like isoform X1 [Anticarsia gemmatalis]|uniref:venom serine protease inhibitor-like isoform X1 n=1 Tax=Anticarsia gemmatalis TaxID=129554 RepID=UPI003F772D15
MAYRVLLVSLFIFAVSFALPSPNEPEPMKCPENEQYTKCSLMYCFKSCEDLNTVKSCPSIDMNCYLPACVCKNDYLRDANGICIPEKNCKRKSQNQVEWETVNREIEKPVKERF